MSTRFWRFMGSLLAILLPVALAAVYGCGLISLLILSFLRSQGTEMPIVLGMTGLTLLAGALIARRYRQQPIVLACVMHVSAAAIFVIATGIPGIIGWFCFGGMAVLVVGGGMATTQHLRSRHPDAGMAAQLLVAAVQSGLWFAAMAYLYTH